MGTMLSKVIEKRIEKNIKGKRELLKTITEGKGSPSKGG